MTTLTYNFPEVTTYATSYIDTADLKEVLQAYYDGTLDDYDPYVDRLYKGLSQLHPTNSLWGQIDSNEMSELLAELIPVHKAVIQYHYQPSEGIKALLTSKYYNYQTDSSFENWVEVTFIEALELLAYGVMEIL